MLILGLGLLAEECLEEDNIQEVIVPAPVDFIPVDFIDVAVANACSTLPPVQPYRPTYYRAEEEEALNIAAIAAVLGAFTL